MIKVKNLKFKYDSKQENVLNDISLNIEKNEHIAILGHNGSGKSTFSKIISGLYRYQDGEIEIDGLSLVEKNLKAIRKKISVVFQNPDNQFIGATVEDDIAFGLENKRITREEMRKIVIEKAEKVGMGKYLKMEPHNLSGGQKQKVAIASALALNAKIIIFDEATSMLDPKSKNEVLNIINSLKGKKTIISITHDMEEAMMADKIYVFSSGKIINQGNPENVFNDEDKLKIANIEKPFINKLSKLINNLDKLHQITFSLNDIKEYYENSNK